MSSFSQYLSERFPVVPYLVLIGAMVAGASAAAVMATGDPVPLSWPQVICVFTILFGFFHLRVFDEHKDYDKDVLAHPGRVLSRGLITLKDLRVAGLVAVTLEVCLNIPLGMHAISWVCSFILFSVAMRFEFGISEWLNQHLVIYAISHNPIVALMMCYVMAVASGGLVFSAPVLWFLAVATLTSLGFELGRKLRAPEDELEGQDTYTGALGVPGAVRLLVAIEVLAVAVTAPLLSSVWALGALAAVGLVMVLGPVLFGQKPSSKSAKMAENTATLGALVIYLLVAAQGIANLGVLWS